MIDNACVIYASSYTTYINHAPPTEEHIMRTIIVAISLLISSSAFAHFGATDSNGCHRDKKAGNYHCHSGEKKDLVFSSKDAFAKGEAGTPYVKSEKKD